MAELATNHGGDVSLAIDLIQAAAEAGADYVKTQAYSLARLNPKDPQADWLRQAHLSREAHAELKAYAEGCGVQYLSTPFDAESLQMLRDLGLTAFKIASSESGNDWWTLRGDEAWFVSLPWGRGAQVLGAVNLTAIPLYPTTLECVGQAKLLDGWSDHTEGLDTCLWAIAQGIQVLEVHVCMPGRGRRCAWDKSPDDLAILRGFADNMETIRTGVSQKFRERWQQRGAV